MIDGQVGNRFRRDPLVAHLNRCEGKSLGELDVAHVFAKTVNRPKVTGIAGDVIEQSVLFLRQNPRQEPDIEVDHVRYEVKTTGVRKSRDGNGYEAKEPVSITAVSPEKIVGEDYGNSSFWHKVAHMLFFYYCYNSRRTVTASEYANFPLLCYQFHEYDDFTEEERRTLERDWTKIRNFISCLQQLSDGRAPEYPRLSHDLRQSLLLLDTAPKWPHRPRFRFKRTFVNGIFARHVEGRRNRLPEKLPEEYVELRDIEGKCRELTARFRGWTVGRLCAEFGIERAKALKSIAEPVIVKMFGGHRKKMRDIDLFSKIGLLGKSVVLTRRGTRTEDCKFFTIDFDEFLDAGREFEESQFYEFFATCRILFAMFEELDAAAPLTMNRFVGFKMVTFDDGFIQREVKPVWERIRHLVQTRTLRDCPALDRRGRPIRNANGELRSAPNFPKSRDGVVFVRGTSSDSSAKPEVVNGIRMYYQQVWIKGSFIARLVEDAFLL